MIWSRFGSHLGSRLLRAKADSIAESLDVTHDMPLSESPEILSASGASGAGFYHAYVLTGSRTIQVRSVAPTRRARTDVRGAGI